MTLAFGIENVVYDNYHFYFLNSALLLEHNYILWKPH